ncbi:uncharacterized protein HMPREF1541_10500 [Cyphellophora europaea CBS 101466]|uniref:AB hydrolase-1 domain-containing protein n=1 Tax=Cyphellophora europaea (strain CBS 101466) TaxID=1220924 RepID=W2S6Q8_CYPE1|nr:uncharacterized protein HMPREF1541_10500 [Cyphellophora europaea CBS 101466]ETN44320.1 hypothetical protein HMPREF1541_10500 [Cyphellophora europaea CBS 101466]
MRIFLPVVPLLTLVVADYSSKKGYTCTEFLLDIPVENATTIVLPLPPIENRYQAISYGQAISTPPGDTPPPPPETSSLTKIFQISGDLCTPNNPGPKSSTIQLLTNGIGYNRTYWDFYLPGSDNPQYSHVHAATAAGYSTLSWNRLGASPSTIADPYSEVQALVEVGILISLTGLARAGKIPGQAEPPANIIHVGHSFGSQLTIGMAALAPEVSDGIVITGLAGDASSLATTLGTVAFQLANENNPERFPKEVYSNGWLTWNSELEQQYIFFSYPNFDPAVLAASEAIKQPLAIGEIFAGGALPTQAPDFSNPVLYLASEHDIACRFDCNDVFGVGSSAWEVFNGTDEIEAFIQPGAGHVLPLHSNVTASYVALDSWIEKHFLA